MPHPDTLLRLACAMWIADPASPMTPTQRTWLIARLADHGEPGHWPPFTPRERAILLPQVLDWMRARRPPAVAEALERLLVPPAPGEIPEDAAQVTAHRTWMAGVVRDIDTQNT